MERWVDAEILAYNDPRNCECGNRCYKIVGGWPGNFMVEWAHDPKECPHGCEDCEQEAQ
jgi:hypothetical protein